VVLLVERLRETYPAHHVVTLYEASPLPGFSPTIIQVKLEKLPSAKILPSYTLYIPPLGQAETDASMVARVEKMLAAAPAKRRASPKQKSPSKKKRSKKK
jgi:hypothetical protein